MDKKKAQGASSLSFTSQLFGPQQSSSQDVFGSIFLPLKEVGQNSGYGGSGTWVKDPTGTVNQPSISNTTQDNTYRPKDASAGSSKERNSIYQQQGVEPCYMSSSLYYGGQESYSQSTTQSTSRSYPTFKKDGREDDPSVSARGDWWQGSLYY